MARHDKCPHLLWNLKVIAFRDVHHRPISRARWIQSPCPAFLYIVFPSTPGSCKWGFSSAGFPSKIIAALHTFTVCAVHPCHFQLMSQSCRYQVQLSKQRVCSQTRWQFCTALLPSVGRADGRSVRFLRLIGCVQNVTVFTENEEYFSCSSQLVHGIVTRIWDGTVVFAEWPAADQRGCCFNSLKFAPVFFLFFFSFYSLGPSGFFWTDLHSSDFTATGRDVTVAQFCHVVQVSIIHPITGSTGLLCVVVAALCSPTGFSFAQACLLEAVVSLLRHYPTAVDGMIFAVPTRLHKKRTFFWRFEVTVSCKLSHWLKFYLPQRSLENCFIASIVWGLREHSVSCFGHFYRADGQRCASINAAMRFCSFARELVPDCQYVLRACYVHVAVLPVRLM